jgi:uncharacterized membrane protein
LSSVAVETAIAALHVLAAAVWVGGTVALVFIAVPMARMFEGEDGVFSGRASTRFYAVFAVKVALVAALATGAFVHDFLLGPGLARQIREGRPQTLRRRLVVVGWFNFTLTLTVPVLGTVLAHLG